MGSPAREAIPSATFGRLLGELEADHGAFDYGPTEGEPALRAELTALPRASTPDELLITSGGMQGLDLVCKLFVGRGDLVAVESPTYTNGTATISGYEGEMVEVPGDEDGMDVDALAALPTAAEADLHDPDVPEPVGRDAVARAAGAADRARRPLGLGRARGRPVQPAALRGRGRCRACASSAPAGRA